MFVLTILVTVCLAGCPVLADSVLEKPYYELEDAENLFENFLKEHKKSYNRREYLERLEIFKSSLLEINLRNDKFPRTVYKVNHFADLRQEELQQYLGFKLSNKTSVKRIIPDGPEPAPDKFDWRDKGVVTHVKDQGHCGSCYIFSAIGNIEGQYALKHNQSLAFSEMQCLDCLYCGSCNGGIMHEVMQELGTSSPGLMKEEDYKYKLPRWLCKEDAKKVIAHLKGGAQIKIPNEDVLKQKLVDIGPLSVALDAMDLFFYHTGVLFPLYCSYQINHGVVLVGYGEENGDKFWTIKNSWGADWGEKGYFRLLRGVDACSMGTGYTASATVL